MYFLWPTASVLLLFSVYLWYLWLQRRGSLLLHCSWLCQGYSIKNNKNDKNKTNKTNKTKTKASKVVLYICINSMDPFFSQILLEIYKDIFDHMISIFFKQKHHIKTLSKCTDIKIYIHLVFHSNTADCWNEQERHRSVCFWMCPNWSSGRSTYCVLFGKNRIIIIIWDVFGIA